MTYVGGIEALHSWSPPGASEPAVTLGEGPFRLLEITGLGSLGDGEANADAIVGAVGENPRLSQGRGKSYAYVGRIIADSMLELREREAELKAAFADRRRQGRMDIAAHPENAELAGQTPKYFEARVLSFDVIDKQVTRRFDRNFVLGLRAADPRVWDDEIQVHTATLERTNEPKEVALVGPDNALGPVLELELPAYANAVAVKLKNSASGVSMTVELPAGWEGKDLVFDWGERTIKDSAGADRSALLSVTDNALWETRQPFAAGVASHLVVEAFAEEKLEGLPTSVIDDASLGTKAWANPGNAKVKDGSYAAVTLATGATSHRLIATGYGFAPAVGSKVVGIQGLFFERASALEVQIAEVKLVIGGVLSGEDKSAQNKNLPTAGSSNGYGASRALWGLTPSNADLSAGNFGISVAAFQKAALGERKAELDEMRLILFMANPYAAKATLRWVQGYY